MMRHRFFRKGRVVGVLAMMVCLGAAVNGCSKAGKSEPDEATPPASAARTAGATHGDDKDKERSGRLKITAEQAQKIGVKTARPKIMEYADEAPGYGAIVAHESFAQAVAEVLTAEAAQKQSQAALARTRRLAGTAGALSSDVEESNARQAAVDAAALSLAKQRLTASFGQNPPWQGDIHAATPTALAAGTDKLVRVTFPLGTAFAEIPKALRISHLGAAPSDKRWMVAPLWQAPADNTVPGRSFFGVIRGTEFTEGERVVAWTPVGKPRPGVLVPAAAVVVTDNKYWCYLAKDAATFVRTEIDAGIPLGEGYFVADGVKPDDDIVVNGAALLLAQETTSGAESD